MELSQIERGIFLINLLGIVFDPETKKILIGRRDNDPYIKELTWTFPGGRPEYTEDLEFYLKKEIRVKTGLEVNVKNIVFAKTYPEKREFLSIYYFCELASGELLAGEKFNEVKWIKPTEVKDYFTTTLHPTIFEFLKTLK